MVDQIETPEVFSRTFPILLSRMSGVKADLATLDKRAARKGLPLLSYSWGKPYTRTEKVPFGVTDFGETLFGDAEVSRIDLTITGDVPKFQGWTFLAALQHLDGENVTRTIPGKTLDPIYRTRGSQCDHCHYNRRRNETYVLSHEDGRTIQVGSTCIQDFLGTDTAGDIASKASYLAEVCGFAEDGCEGSGRSSSPDAMLSDFLVWVAFAIRDTGWISRTKARDAEPGTPGSKATADHAWSLLTDIRYRSEWFKGRKADTAEQGAADIQRANDSIQWAENLSDDEINREQGDYLHNIRTIARSGLVTFKTAGLGGSIVSAWDRAMGRERLATERAARPTLNEYQGTVGDKIVCGPVKVKKGQAILSPDPLLLDFVTGYETEYGYTTILKFRTTLGATLVWKASSTDLDKKDVGKYFTLSGTIKAHTEYKGAKQTVLTRCKVTEVPADKAAEVAA